jgi:hypothetical protein
LLNVLVNEAGNIITSPTPRKSARIKKLSKTTEMVSGSTIAAVT